MTKKFEPKIRNGRFVGYNGLKWIEFNSDIKDVLESHGYCYVGSMSNQNRFGTSRRIHGVTHFYSNYNGEKWSKPETSFSVAKLLGIEDVYRKITDAKEQSKTHS